MTENLDWDRVQDLHDSGMSQRAIARLLGFNQMSISYALKRMEKGYTRGRRNPTVFLDYEEMDSLIRDGKLNNGEIARHLDCAASSVFNRRRDLGLSNNPAKNADLAPIEGRLDEARAMFEDGASRTEVSSTLGMSWATVDRYFPGTAWDRQKISQHGVSIQKANREIRKKYPKLGWGIHL